MPFINIQMMEGRTLKQKRDLVAQMTKVVCETIDAKPEKVRIVISEFSPENISQNGKLNIDKNL